MTNNAILVVGSVAFDDVETPFGKVEHVLGGSTLYFAAAASLFAPVRVVSVVGRDMDLDDLRFLEQRGVDLGGLQVEEGKTFHWAGRYHYEIPADVIKEATETLQTDLNVYADFRPRLPEHYAESENVFLANIHPALQRDVLTQTRRPRLTMMDTMNLWINTERDEVRETIRLVDIVSINESEVRLFSGTSSVIKGTRAILDLGPRAVLVKRGEYGAALFTRDDYFVAPTYPIEDVYDPTGAGDSFAGGFLGYLARAGDLSFESMRRALIYGIVVGSFTVERFSLDRLRDLTLTEVRHRVAALRGFTQFEDEVAVGANEA